MTKPEIIEDKSTPSGELLDWINRWIHRGVNRSETIGLLTLCVRYLEAEAIKAMMGAESKKGEADMKVKALVDTLTTLLLYDHWALSGVGEYGTPEQYKEVEGDFEKAKAALAQWEEPQA